MRVVEPHQFDGLPEPRLESSKKAKFFGALCAVLVLGAGATVYSNNSGNKANDLTASISQVQSQQPQVEGVTAEKKELKTFTGNEFKVFFDNLAYPNTVDVRNPPEITGDTEADVRIQSLAQARGYRLRPIAANQPFEVDGFSLQQKTVEPWKALKAAASAEGHNIKIIAAFRSIDDQRALFLERLTTLNVSKAQIASGDVDAEIMELLSTTAPPGYSRHHSGFAVDLDCASNPGAFLNTACFRWLSKNNYQNAKNFGWIPSYPDDTAQQGPEPEPWEYTWVGQDALLE